MKNSKNFALLNLFLKYPWYIFNGTCKLHIHTETSLACVEAAEVLMSFLKFRIYFVVIYIYIYIYGKNMWKYKHEYAKSLI